MYCVKQFEKLFETEYNGVWDSKAGESEYGAFYVEAIQGTGGYVVPPKEYFPMLQAILKKHNILLVDDEDLVRLSTADMLVDLGYVVVETASAEEAVRVLARGDAFDAVITDHLMPGMTGTDLARHIQAVRPQLPVLLVSGYAEAEGVDIDLPRLTKPFRKDDLASALAGMAAAHKPGS